MKASGHASLTCVGEQGKACTIRLTRHSPIEFPSEKVQCYQEQWEIYKLDPNYHCVVYPWPKCPSVTWIELPNQGFETTDPCSGKRSRWSSPETSEPVAQKKVRSRPADKSNGTTFDSEESEDEVEVEEMIVDENFSQKSTSNSRYSNRRDRIHKERRGRWERIRMVYQEQVQDFTTTADGSFSMRVDSDPIPSWPTEENKRKGNFLLHDPCQACSHDFQATHPQNLTTRAIKC